MGADRATLEFYTAEAERYAAGASAALADRELAVFVRGLPPGGDVLDFGCGSGWAADHFRRQGFRVRAFDGSAGLAAQARVLYGLDVTVGPFENFAARAAFDGIWASFCLLHDTRKAMPGHLARLHAALRPGGLLYLGLKEGAGSVRDGLGRRYTYYSRDEIGALLGDAGFGVESAASRIADSYEGHPEPCLHVFARRG